MISWGGLGPSPWLARVRCLVVGVCGGLLSLSLSGGGAAPSSVCVCVCPAQQQKRDSAERRVGTAAHQRCRPNPALPTKYAYTPPCPALIPLQARERRYPL